MEKELIIVLNFGGQYNQLIARRVRECNVYAEVQPYTKTLEQIAAMKPKGIIFTGGPNSVYDEKSPHYDPAIFQLGIPILGICYGSQLMAYELGGQVKTAPVSEYGHTDVIIDDQSDALFTDVPKETVAWMSHTDYIAKVPEGFKITAHTENCPVAAMSCPERKLYATQFHPEVMHTTEGRKMLRHFVMDVCGCTGSWRMDSFVDSTVKELREKIGDSRVLLGLSGGIDSAVAAALLSRAIGRNLYCVFVDHGLMRKNEGDEVEAVFGPKGNFDLNFIRVNAGERYFAALKGVTDPETKRKTIGDLFVDVFGEQAKKLHDQGGVGFLAQGTIYPDVIESGGGTGAAVIKSHHNVGGLPIEKVEEFGFDKTPVEPLRLLFKDEVRAVGRQLGLPDYLVNRQPFPGPGLGIRIIGEVTPEKVKIVQEADAIWREEIDRSDMNPKPDQYYAALTNMRSVGVMGDFRTYDYAVALRAVNTSDFMTADASQVPWEVLSKVTNRIVNEVRGVNRVFYDCTGKPPATIELE